jgi:predicted secreted protein
MRREKKIVLVAHCVLNSNAKVEGLANYKGALKELVHFLVDSGYGIMQLPCPETTVYGIKRWGHVKEQFNTPFFRKQCRLMLESLVDQVVDLSQNGYHFGAVIGIDGSPSCGVGSTCSSALWGGEVSNRYGLQDKIENIMTIDGKGILMEELEKMLDEHGAEVPFIAVDEANPDASISRIKKFFRKKEQEVGGT